MSELDPSRTETPQPHADAPIVPATTADPRTYSPVQVEDRRMDLVQVSLIVGTAVLLVLSGFLVGLIVQRNVIGNASPEPTIINTARIDRVARIIEGEFYFAPGDDAEREAFRQFLEQEALRGMTASLGDPYTVYLPPVEAEPAQRALAGEYEGIGVTVESIDGWLTIVAPTPGGPAERAGLLPGDVIAAADGVSLEDLSTAEASDYVRGPAGSEVVLTIERPDREERLEIAVTRERLEDQVVFYELDDETRIARISIRLFNDNTTMQLDAILTRVAEDDVTGIILDLRNNGGGWVVAAQEVIGRFVPVDAGPALYEDPGLQHGGDELLTEPIIAGEISAFDLPMVVLVNRGTASAAEIVAGALNDYDRAVLIGEPTFGKGSVQRVHDFVDGASLRVTIAQWFTPEGTEISMAGLPPTVLIAMGDPHDGVDDQLVSAFRYLVSGGWSAQPLGW